MPAKKAKKPASSKRSAKPAKKPAVRSTFDSLHEIAIGAPPEKVYAAWTTGEGLRAWWTADASTPGAGESEYVFRFDRGTVGFHFRVESEVPGERVLWRGVKGPGMPAEWVGTTIDVRVTPSDEGRTRMQFGHRGWRSAKGRGPLFVS
jgi:uncharacterized protein YndB with AHSA1/START domain